MYKLRIAALIVVLIGIALAFGVRHSQQQATTLLEDVKRLDTAKEPFAAFEDFRQKHQKQLVNEKCSENICESEFFASNWLLSHLRLAPRTELRVRVSAFKHSLNTLNIEYSTWVFPQDNPVVHVQEDFCADRTDIPCSHFDLNPHGQDVTPIWNGSIEFGQLARDEQRRAAWDLNTSCFSASHACGDIAQLAPRIWKTTGEGKISSCLRSNADSMAELSRPLSGVCSAK